MEKWILRTELAVLLGLAVWAVAISMSDIKRYIKIRQM